MPYCKHDSAAHVGVGVAAVVSKLREWWGLRVSHVCHYVSKCVTICGFMHKCFARVQCIRAYGWVDVQVSQNTVMMLARMSVVACGCHQVARKSFFFLAHTTDAHTAASTCVTFLYEAEYNL